MQTKSTVEGARWTLVLRIAALVPALIATACSPPIQARRVDPRVAHRLVLQTELTAGKLSQHSRNLVYDRDLRERFAADPAAALRDLHQSFVDGRELHESLAAAAELSFHHAECGGGRPYYLAAALYAWAYLFPDDPALRPDRFSPRLRLACDLYNRSVTAVMKDGKNVVLRGGPMALPFGTLDVAFDPAAARWSTHTLTDFVPIDELEVEGLPTVFRWPGIGAPLAAGVAATNEGEQRSDLLGRKVRVPVTAVLRFGKLDGQLGAGRWSATLEVYPGYGDRKIAIAGQEVPLESEPTAAVALTLTQSPVWDSELWGFLRGAILKDQARLVSVTPYEPGMIPVVFVHGTASSSGRWAELYNELDNDPRLHDRYQFWFFSYETGNPIAYSAMRLREALEAAVSLLDPQGRDAALRRMVVIGHSQGGLLTRSTVTESGLDFWKNVSTRSPDEISVSDTSRDLLRRALIFHPLPFVRRVIFLATPHRGSYVAGSWLAHQFARLVHAPLDVANVMTDLVTGDRAGLAFQTRVGVPSSVDNMTPGNPYVRTLSAEPIAPGVHAHSIIAVKDGIPSATANDGVVEYTSAHLDGVDSELVVTSSHSCQDNPHTIAEVRRILLEHLHGDDVDPRTRARP